MAAYKDEKRKTWYVQFYYTDWDGKRKKKWKRGFETKREALSWERNFVLKAGGTADVAMKDFYSMYKEDVFSRMRLNTWMTKEHMIETKILPFFGEMKLTEITPLNITKWHTILLNAKKEDGGNFADTYLKTIHVQLSAMLNHAVKNYGLHENPCRAVERIGSNRGEEIEFWSKEQYLKFSKAIMDKDVSFYAFQILYWCGIRIGELRALTKGDFDINKKTLRIDKSTQTIKGEDIVTKPKTASGVRTIAMPDFLADQMEEYFLLIEDTPDDKPIFPRSKAYFHTEMTRGSKIAGVPRIRVHALRHSHVSLLIEMGFSAVDIAKRVGHSSISITLDYAHMFPSKQDEMAKRLNRERDDSNGQGTETSEL
ncbi:MAG: Uncharacterized protein XD91_1578 [Clostridiales bacterium 38_11]|nr:MAG: Uncharacterized protein XD91_1578 [Clostridiales bacterium 38_11]